jgi:HPt (histidine-containing phosphotransfer) domain-containing protein
VTLVECATVAKELLDPPDPDDEARGLAASSEAAEAFATLLELSPQPPASLEVAEQLFDALKSTLRDRDAKLGPSLRALRSLLTGRAHGPEFPFVLATLTAERIERARASLSENA